MTSKEALERLNKHFNMSCYNFSGDENSKVNEYEIIKKDLDRLEKLEQENEDLKEELELLKKKYYELKEQLSSGNL